MSLDVYQRSEECDVLDGKSSLKICSVFTARQSLVSGGACSLEKYEKHQLATIAHSVFLGKFADMRRQDNCRRDSKNRDGRDGRILV